MTVELVLAGFVGLVIGVLAALWVDSQKMVRQTQDVRAEKSKAQEALQKFQIQHRALEQELQMVKKETDTAVLDTAEYEATIARQLTEIEASRSQLQTSINSQEVLRENLQEFQDRLEELEGLKLIVEEKLAASEADNNRLVGDTQLMEAEIMTLGAKIEQLTEALHDAQCRSTELEQKAATIEAQHSALEAEKDMALGQLQEAELAAAEQSARSEALQTRLRTAESLRQELEAAEEKLQTADSHIEKLEDAVEDVQTMIRYSGKNQLELIRGIGPAYARRLSEFGIQSFGDLAECNPEQIAAIIKKKNWQSADIQEWIDEAKALAARLGPDE